VSEDFSIQIDLSEWEQFADQMRDAPELLESHMTAAMDGSLNEIVTWITTGDQMPTNTGALKGSFTTEITGEAVNLTGIVSTPLVYGWPMEAGRKAGSTPPPVAPILLWVKRKKIRFDSKAKTKGGKAKKMTYQQTAYIIARSIGKKGIPAHGFVKAAYNRAKSGPEIAKIWEYELEAFLKELAT